MAEKDRLTSLKDRLSRSEDEMARLKEAIVKEEKRLREKKKRENEKWWRELSRTMEALLIERYGADYKVVIYPEILLECVKQGLDFMPHEIKEDSKE